MPHDHSHPGMLADRSEPIFAVVMALLLAMCWSLGGVTVDSTRADDLLQLLALPVLLWAAWRLVRPSLAPPTVTGLLLAGAVMAIPLWQLLPLPYALGSSGAVRQALAADLAGAGVPMGSVHASLSTLATERSLWSLLPALALFLGALRLPLALRRRLLQVVLALVLGSAAFAFFQLWLPDGSPLLLYTTWGRNFGGLFVNPNHQGTALALGAVIATALFVDGRRRARDEAHGHRHWLYGFLAAACLAMVPLANGSAAMLLVLAGLVAVVVLQGALQGMVKRGGSGVLRVGAIAAVMVIVLASALAWQRTDVDRRSIATQTLHIGQQYAPLGSGVGTFVPVFAQSQDMHKARSELINHAHNEYVQWWLEGGVPALLVMGSGLGVFAWSGWCILLRMPSRRLRAVAAPAWSGILILLLHSLVDFPLRTTTLMATCGLLAGLLLATMGEGQRDIRSRRHRDAAPQPA